MIGGDLQMQIPMLSHPGGGSKSDKRYFNFRMS